jgi:hypothetical protein
MSFDQLNAIAKENHETRKWETHTLFMNLSTSKRLREKSDAMGTTPKGMLNAGMTEAFEMSAAKHGIPFGMPLMGLTPEIRVQVDDSLPEGTWRLVSPDGTIAFEGTLD